MQLLFHSNQIPESCDIRKTKFKSEIFHPLHTQNSWLFVTPNRIDATLNCKTESPRDFPIEGTGIITLPPKCRLFTNSAVLKPINKNLTSGTTLDITFPSFNILEDHYSKQNIKNTSPEITPLHINNLDIESLDIVNHKLFQISDKIDDVESFNILQNSYFVYFLMTTLKFIGLYVLYKIYKHIKSKYRNRKGKPILPCITAKQHSEVIDHDPEDIELPETNQSPLRRSTRIAKLKS